MGVFFAFEKLSAMSVSFFEVDVLKMFIEAQSNLVKKIASDQTEIMYFEKIIFYVLFFLKKNEIYFSCSFVITM